MTRALRDALHAAADDEGCSLNAYALQILAAAAGDPARFRGTGEPAERARDLRDVQRDERGFPTRRTLRGVPITARLAFFEAMMAEGGAAEAQRIVSAHDVEDPAFFVEWAREREAAD